MNTALFFTCTLWAPLLRWGRRRFGPSTGANSPAAHLRMSGGSVAAGAMPVLPQGARPPATRAPTGCARPLRVVRVVDAGQTRGQTGRLVISGRMADVCAELDRLAALEAARA